MAAMARPDRLMLTPAIANVMPPTELKPRAQTRMTAAMIRLRELVKSTLFSTTLRTPMAEIMPYSTKLMPPTMPEGIVLMMASNFGQKLRIIANTAAMRMTRGS